MFENIIGQKETIGSLKKAIEQKRLPQSLLFAGPHCSGKLSAALELARVLGCERQGAWNCSCNGCDKNRLLIQQNLLMMGSRNYFTEISAAADVFMRTKQLGSRYLFIRAVRKQLRMFDPILWEGDESKIKTLRSSINKLEEHMNTLAPGLELPSEKELKKFMDDVLKHCAKLTAASKSENIPVNHVRKATFWAHHSIPGTKKVVIVENADKMQDSSRNSLLKILEEPPENVYFILITSRKGALIRTILSRVRPYNFLERTEVEASLILEKIFKEDTGEFRTLRDFFLAWKELNPRELKNLARKYVSLILGRGDFETGILGEIDKLFAGSSPKEAFSSLIEELVGIFQNMLHQREEALLKHQIQCGILQKWMTHIQESLYNFEFLNINPKNLLESLFYKMRSEL